jgi:hypothetical protein
MEGSAARCQMSSESVSQLTVPPAGRMERHMHLHVMRRSHRLLLLFELPPSCVPRVRCRRFPCALLCAAAAAAAAAVPLCRRCGAACPVSRHTDSKARPTRMNQTAQLGSAREVSSARQSTSSA